MHEGRDPRPYADKLRDPRWQKRRLEILSRDQWTCQLCGDQTSTLAVHHRYYLAGHDPWDYPREALVTLCDFCHERETRERPEVEQQLLALLRRIGDMFGIRVKTGHSAITALRRTAVLAVMAPVACPYPERTAQTA
jgi:hypothetical protein